MDDRIREIRLRYDDVSQALANPGIHADPSRLRDLSREHSQLAQVVEAAARLEKTRDDLDGARALLAESEGDAEMAAMAKAEIEQLTGEVERLEGELKRLLVPRDPLDDRDA
ncbi:MAG TPA: PCRF domain-containing protein, partial [Longimicrobiaceae bacterium]